MPRRTCAPSSRCATCAPARSRRAGPTCRSAGDTQSQRQRALVGLVELGLVRLGEALAEEERHRADQLGGTAPRSSAPVAPVSPDSVASIVAARAVRSPVANCSARASKPSRSCTANGSTASAWSRGDSDGVEACTVPRASCSAYTMSGARSSSPRAPPTAVGDSWPWIAPSVRPSSRGLGVGQPVELGGELDVVGQRGVGGGDRAVLRAQRLAVGRRAQLAPRRRRRPAARRPGRRCPRRRRRRRCCARRSRRRRRAARRATMRHDDEHPARDAAVGEPASVGHPRSSAPSLAVAAVTLAADVGDVGVGEVAVGACRRRR